MWIVLSFNYLLPFMYISMSYNIIPVGMHCMASLLSTIMSVTLCLPTHSHNTHVIIMTAGSVDNYTNVVHHILNANHSGFYFSLNGLTSGVRER